MKTEKFTAYLEKQITAIKQQGLYKPERIISSPQGAHIESANKEVINLCANNYLGLANNPILTQAAKDALEKFGYGMASVRFICGTQSIHKELERKLSNFLNTEDTILYSSCFDANTGLFETFLGEEDAIVSDELNHASIIDGIRLCKAKRFRYKNNDMADLKAKLEEAKNSRFIMLATDGVFSMDGVIANLPDIVELAHKYDAIVMVDDSHAVGFLGATGKGTPEALGVSKEIDILTGTMGKALGGASGGYVSGRKEMIEWLRQRSRPYLFSNSLAPMIAAASIAAIDLIGKNSNLLSKLKENSSFFREEMNKANFDLIKGEHPIIPVMMYDAIKAQKMAEALLKRGIYAIGFSYPVVGQGKARIRTQMSAAHSQDDLAKAVKAFIEARAEIA